jgi:putative hydrolase of HD superfamily
MINKRLKKQIEFIIEVDKLKNIHRRSYITDSKRNENDAEHSWHISLMAVILSEYSNFKELDLLKVIKMLLIHDIVEIDAGDVMIYDLKNQKTKLSKEIKAAERIFSKLPLDQKNEFHSLWIEFEERKTKESKFARVLDRLEPIILNYCSKGKTWKENKTKSNLVLDVNKIIDDGASKLWDYAKELIEDAEIGRASCRERVYSYV